MGDGPIAIRIPFASPYEGRSGFWYLRKVPDGPFRLSWQRKGEFAEHGLEDFDNAERAVESLADKLTRFFQQQWDGYQKVCEMVRTNQIQDRPGFRPGRNRLRFLAELPKYQQMFVNNDKTIATLRNELSDAGWPPIAIAVPWTL